METLLLILLYLNMLIVADAPLTQQAMDEFAHKMEPYYTESGIPSDTSNASLYSLPNTYWGATVWSDRCTSRVFLSERFTNPNHPFYNTPMWKYVLAHEWAHVAQGKHCWENEAEAQLIALAILADAGEWGAVITALEWMFTLQVPDANLDPLHLSTREEAYYRSVDLPGSGIVELLLEEDDGSFELRTGRLEARNLWILISTVTEKMVGPQEFEAR